MNTRVRALNPNQMNQYFKRVTPVNWLLIAVILVVSCIAVFQMRGKDSLREQNNALKVTIQGNQSTIESNKAYIDAIDIDIKKKQTRIDSLQALVSASKTTVVTIYKERDERINIIRNAGRDTTRRIFTDFAKPRD